jgi:Protein of unknown function (DUF433)
MTETELLSRIQVNPTIFGGKPIIRGLRIAVEHILGMLLALCPPLLESRNLRQRFETTRWRCFRN